MFLHMMISGPHPCQLASLSLLAFLEGLRCRVKSMNTHAAHACLVVSSGGAGPWRHSSTVWPCGAGPCEGWGAARHAICICTAQAPWPSARRVPCMCAWPGCMCPARYAKGVRPAGAPLAVKSVLGKPQIKAGKTKCEPNRAIAWSPSMARPRELEVYYNTNVLLSQVHGVVLSIVNVGSQLPAVQSVQLLMQASKQCSGIAWHGTAGCRHVLHVLHGVDMHPASRRHECVQPLASWSITCDRP